MSVLISIPRNTITEILAELERQGKVSTSSPEADRRSWVYYHRIAVEFRIELANKNAQSENETAQIILNA